MNELVRRLDERQSSMTPSPFYWRDPASIAPRQWLYGNHLVRKYVSTTIAPGGIGKSTLLAADAVAMASGRNLVSAKPYAPLRVWLWNGEDPAEEIERRVIATCLRHQVKSSELADRLFLDSGRDMPIKIGCVEKGTSIIATPVVNKLVDAIQAYAIDVLIVDPFVSIHSLPENDNGAMDAAVKAFADIANRTNCAIDLVHHSRKLNGADADIDSARGGSAIAGAVRAARVLNVMSGDAARAFSIAEGDRRSYVRIDGAKANLGPPSAAQWIKLAAEPLGNSTSDRPEDWVAVAESWTPPDALAGIGVNELIAVQKAVAEKGYRENAQANSWVGHAIAPILGLSSRMDPDRQRIKNAVKIWVKSGALIIKTVRDDKGHDRPVIEVGEWANT